MTIFGYRLDGEGKGTFLESADLDSVGELFLKKSGYDYFTNHSFFCTLPLRIRGKYHLKTTTATLEFYLANTAVGAQYELRIKFINLDEARKLHDLIRDGKIWPDVCYENEQVPAPCRHLKGLLGEMFGIIRREVAKRLHFA
jgi:hypothetical protein